MKKNILIILSVLLQTTIQAQLRGQARIDSMARVIQTAKVEDTIRVKTWNLMSLDLSRSGKPDTAIEILAISLNLAKKINFRRGEADAYYFLGQAWANKSKVNEAIMNYEYALKNYQDMPNRKVEEAECYYGMGMVHQRSNYDKALQFFKRSLSVAQQSDHKNMMGKAAYIIAVIYMRKGDYNEAPYYNGLAVKYYTETANETGLANCFVASSRIHEHNGNYQQALKDNYTALRLFEKTQNKVGIYNVHTGLGLIYEEQKNYTEALTSYLAAKKAAEEFGNKEVLSGAFNNVGNMYRELGKTDEALNAFQESLKLARIVGDKKGTATAMGNIGTIYARTGKPNEALKSYGEAEALFEEVGAKESISRGYLETAQVYFDLKKFPESKASVEKAIELAKQIGNKDVISKSYELLSQVETASGDFVSAFDHYKQYISYRDSISNAGVTKQLVEQRMQYAFSKKEDSMRLEQALIAEQLEKQTLLSKQQQQELLLKQSSLELAQRQKDVQRLSFLKTQAELQLSNEQNEKKLTIAEQEKALQQSQLEKQTLLSKQNEQTLLIKDKELSVQKSQRNFWIVGAIALLLLSFFIFGNYRNQRKANTRLKEQQIKTEQALKELKATQTQLIHSEKMASLGVLTAGIAHEIQNPLNFVNNFSELNNDLLDEMRHELQSGKFEKALEVAKDIKENNSKINHHGSRADAIVKGMLQHSRAGSNKKESTDINQLADEYLRLSYHGLRAKDKEFIVHFTSNFDANIGKVEVIPQDIGRVLLNLYNNAFYAVHEKKKKQNGGFEPAVSVTTKRSGNKLEIAVRDNGTGIPQASLDKIYQPFFTTKPTGQGTGLGLSISYDIIKAHGGDLKVKTKEGEFAEFIIQVPVSNSNAN